MKVNKGSLQFVHDEGVQENGQKIQGGLNDVQREVDFKNVHGGEDTEID